MSLLLQSVDPFKASWAWFLFSYGPQIPIPVLCSVDILVKFPDPSQTPQTTWSPSALLKLVLLPIFVSLYSFQVGIWGCSRVARIRLQWSWVQIFVLAYNLGQLTKPLSEPQFPICKMNMMPDAYLTEHLWKLHKSIYVRCSTQYQVRRACMHKCVHAQSCPTLCDPTD